MPAVPYLEAPTVQAEGLPGKDNPKFDTSVPDADAPIAQGLQTAADLGVARQAEFKRQADQVRLVDFASQLKAGSTELQYGKDNPDGTRTGGVFSLRGTDAVNLPAKILPQFDQLSTQLMAGLTPDQQRLAKIHVSEERANLHIQLSRYEAQQADATAQAVYENGAQQTIKSASLGWRDPDVLERSRSDIQGLVKMEGDRNGWSAEQRDAALAGRLSDLHRNVVAQMLGDDSPSDASRYLDNVPRGELAPNDEKHLRDLVDVGRAGDVSDSIVSVYKAQGPEQGAKAYSQLDKMDLPEDVKNIVRSNIQKGLGLWRDEQRQKYGDQIEQMHQNIASGNASAADKATAWTLYRQGAISAEEAGSTIGSIDRSLKKQSEDDTSFGYVATARQNGIALDPADKDVKAAIDGYALRQTKGMTPGSAQYATEIADIASKTKVVPQSAIAWARTQLVGGDPASAAAAADLMDRLHDASPRGMQYAADDKRTSAMADSISTAVKAGTPPEIAVQNAREADQRSDAAQKVLDQRWSAAKTQTGFQPTENALRNQLSNNPALKASWWSGVPRDDKGHLPPEMVGEFEQLTREYFDHTGGDLAQARKLAARDVQNTWALSSINGKPELMKLAPEATTGLSTPILRQHLESFVADNAGAAVLPDPKTGRPTTQPIDPKSARLVPVPETARTNGKVWGVLVSAPDGTKDTLVDKQGRPFAYRLPNPQAAIEDAKKAEADKGMAEAREKQAGKQEFDRANFEVADATRTIAPQLR